MTSWFQIVGAVCLGSTFHSKLSNMKSKCGFYSSSTIMLTTQLFVGRDRKTARQGSQGQHKVLDLTEDFLVEMLNLAPFHCLRIG